MNSKPNKQQNFSNETPAAMDQVRDLLFGAQIKEMDTRVQRLEERFNRTVEDAKGTVKNRVDSLENFMKSEVASLLARIKEEQDERSETLKSEQRERSADVTQLTKDLGASVEATERKLAKLASTLDTTERELRQLLLTECGSLNEKIQEKYQSSLNVLSNTAAQIRSDMVYRASLASMFTETALKLNGQWASEMEIGSDENTLPSLPPEEVKHDGGKGK